MKNSHFGAWVAVRVSGGMAAGLWLVTQDLTPSAPIHLESLEKEQLNWALLWARASTAGFAERTILTHLTLSKCWLAASPYQTWNVAGGSLMPNTLSDHSCWVQRLQVWLVWIFFSLKLGHFCLPCLIYTMEDHTSTEERFVGFYSSVTCTPLLHCFTNHFFRVPQGGSFEE